MVTDRALRESEGLHQVTYARLGVGLRLDQAEDPETSRIGERFQGRS
jgi:hypothetical protein